MPQYRNPFEKGDLYIKFDVQFPDNNWISPEKLVVCIPSSSLWFIVVNTQTPRTAAAKSQIKNLELSIPVI